MNSLYDNAYFYALSSLIRISAGRRIFAPLRSFSQLVTSFFGAMYQGILRMLFVAWSLLDSAYFALSPSLVLSYKNSTFLTRLIILSQFKTLIALYFVLTLLILLPFFVLYLSSLSYAVVSLQIINNSWLWAFYNPLASANEVRLPIARSLTLTCKRSTPFCARWWAQMDSNHRPHAYQACALTSWAMSPLNNLTALVEVSGIEPLTPCLQGRCSTSWAKPPLKIVV